MGEEVLSVSSKKPKTVKDTSERYLLTYSDLMNLLLILFIVLFSMSQIDVAKFKQLAQSFQTVGISTGTKIIPVSGGGNTFNPTQNNLASPVIHSNMEEERMEEVKKEVDKMIEKKGLKNDVDVSIQERGIVISINAKLLFKSGSAILEANSKPTIQEIGDVLLKTPTNRIKVEGHTDSDPMDTLQYPSNWELSTARAINVLKLLVNNMHIDPHKISAVGFGEYQPKVSNTTETNKAINRRVDIVILKDKYDEADIGNVNTEN